MHRLAVIAVTVVVAAAGATAASAATRFVAVGGVSSGACSSPSEACSPAWALSVAEDGDRVLIAPGTYPLAPDLPQITKEVVVGGDPAQPRPVLLSSGGSPGDWVLWLGGAAGKRPVLEHVDIRQEGAAGYALVLGAATLATAQDLLVSSTAGSGPVVDLTGNLLLRDSVVRAEAPIATIGGLPAGSSADLRNVTAAGGSYGLSCSTSAFSPALPATVTVRNSILLGSAAGITAGGADPTRKCLVLADHSNFPSQEAQANGVVDTSGGADQTAPPLFTDLPGGNLHEAVGSPTIDAGIADPLDGLTDPDGRPRSLGSAPDIGAYEFAPPAGPAQPPPPSSPAVLTRPLSVTLTGVPRTLTAAALRRGIKVRVTTSEPADLTATISALRGAHGFLSRLVPPTAVTLGSAVLARGSGTRTVVLRARARALGRATRLKATLTVLATDAAGNTARVTRSLRVAPATRR